MILKDILLSVKNKDKRKTGKFMTLIENYNVEAMNELKKFYLEDTKAFTIGITGPPGAGKSTIISQLIEYYRSKDLTVGVIAVDPTSLFSGGAFLGDRVRMDKFYLDEHVFIRSMASKGKLGGIAPATSKFIKILEVFGCDIIIIETTGTGQSEIEINQLVDSVLVVAIPGTGDAIQSLKAGIMEIADIFVLNKADLEGKDKLKLFLERMIELERKSEDQWNPVIVETISNKGNLEENGIQILSEKLEDHQRYLENIDQEDYLWNKMENELLSLLREKMNLQIQQKIDSKSFKDAVSSVVQKKKDPITVIDELFDL